MLEMSVDKMLGRGEYISMFKGFNLKLNEDFFWGIYKGLYFKDLYINEYEKINFSYEGKNGLERIKPSEVKGILRKNIKESTIDADNAGKSIFPRISDCRVFISHSHDDEKLAKAFGGWLYEHFKIKAFIDSSVWGCAHDLLWEIDSEFSRSKRDGNVIDYTMSTITASHVHMMLSTALSDMIAETECVIFINTPSSIIVEDDIKKIGEKEKTHSAWIHYELVITKLIKRTTPQWIRNSHNLISEGAVTNMAKRASIPVRFIHGASLNHLDILEMKELHGILKDYKKSSSSIDDDEKFFLRKIYGLK